MLFSSFLPCHWAGAADQEPEQVQLLRSRLESLNILTGTLVQEKEFKNIGATLTANGRFMFVQNHGLYWSFATPFPLEYYYSFVEEKLYSRTLNSQDFTTIKAGRWVALLPSMFALDLVKLKRTFSVDYEQVDYEQVASDQVNSYELKKTVFITLSPKARSLKKRLAPIRIKIIKHVEHLVVETIGAEKTEWFFSDIVEDAGSILPWVETLGLPIHIPASVEKTNTHQPTP